MRGTPEQPGNSSGDEEGEGSKIRKRRREREEEEWGLLLDHNPRNVGCSSLKKGK